MKSNSEREKFIRNSMKEIERKERLTHIAYDSWVIFKNIHPESESFKMYIDLIDGYLGALHEDYNFTPIWIKDYHKRRMLYRNPHKIKVERELQKMELDTAIEMQIAGPGIYHSFKHRNLLLELILN